MIGRAARQVSTSLQAVASVFSNADMRRLQLSWAAASFALWAFAISLAVYAFDIGGAAAVGIAALVRLLPGALASPFAGLLGDRHSRRLVLLLSVSSAAVVLGGAALAVALDAPLAAVLALAGLFTVTMSPYIPAESALLPAVARTPQELSAANVAHAAMDNAGFLAGSVLTGVLLAVASPEAAFALAAVASVCGAILVVGLSRDSRPSYIAEATAGAVVRETARGAGALLGEARLRLAAASLTLLVFIEGAADVLIVIVALDLLGLGPGSVGYLNAAWGVGALLAAAPLALLLERRRLAAAILGGGVIVGAAMALPAVWVVPVAAYLAWAGVGVGYDFVEVASRTLLQRLGSDETLARAVGTLETSRLAAMALGAIAVPGLIALVGIQGALIAIGALLPAFALLRWGALRSLEIGAPVEEQHFSLLRDNRIFAPLPLDTLERLCHSLVAVAADPGEEIIIQGDHGDRFYLIESGEVEVVQDGTFRCAQSAGEAFGEIALLRDVARTATVRATCRTTLLALERDHFISAVTGHHRSQEVAGMVVSERLDGRPSTHTGGSGEW
jgi:hypothetical protein